MRIRGPWLLCGIVVAAQACKPPVQNAPPPASASAELVALSGASVFIGVGDIASCDSRGDEQTAALVDSILKGDSVAKVNDAVFTLGDNAYPSGRGQDFANCFTPSWGDSTKRIMKKIRPTPGNHEHLTGMAAPYYAYFGDKAGSSKKGYYSYDVGEWHVIALNSEMLVNGGFAASDVQDQLTWLGQDLQKNQKVCTLAYWHHPRYSSGWHGSDQRIDAIWQLLYNAGVDLILNGHDHEYERFEPLSPAGMVDSARGMVEIVAGTGGGELRGFSRIAPHSAFRLEGRFGVLKLTLGAREYQHALIDVTGRIWDPGAGKCH
ncbi:MAG: metallophosphoesterase [Gemmatimonadota bacterium]